jgi:hypothetical protein
MTELHDKPIIRLTAGQDRGRRLVVRMTPDGVVMWPKGRRVFHGVAWDAIYDLARKLTARENAKLR